jgi:hypothetical protein
LLSPSFIFREKNVKVCSIILGSYLEQGYILFNFCHYQISFVLNGRIVTVFKLPLLQVSLKCGFSRGLYIGQVGRQRVSVAANCFVVMFVIVCTAIV